MNVAELLVQSLENEGVRFVFGVPGEENEELLFALDASPITFVPTRHEQGAAFIANVWGRLTGRAGVCLATLGPGAANLMTGVADANLDKVPLVALTAQGGLSRLHHESHQYLDVINMFKPITKWNSAISSPAVVTEVVRKAFKLAEAEKPGATHIELSEDVAHRHTPDRLHPIKRRQARRPGPDRKAIRRTAELLAHSQRPLIFAGNGAIRERTCTQLTHLVETYHLPVASTFMGKGAISDRRPESLLTMGLGFRDFVLEALDDADLIIAVGYDIGECAPQTWNPAGDKSIVHIDFVPAEVYDTYVPEVEVVGDIGASLWELERLLSESTLRLDTDWYAPVRKAIVEDIASYELDEGDLLTIPGTLNTLRRILPDNGLLISDVGSNKMWIARNFPTYIANGCIISNGLATMGISLPGGIAASLIDPRRKVVSAMGDAGFLMNSQELETARRLGVSYTILVFNDDDYGLISWKQRISKGRSVGTSIGNPDLVTYAESFGIDAYRPRTPRELESVLETAIASDELNLVEVRIDPSVNDDLVRKLEEHWRR